MMINQNKASPHIILVGCVKKKLSSDRVIPAKDLYISRLYECRRAYAKRYGCPWYILSAKYGLLDPDTKIEWYDLAMEDLSAKERKRWSCRVLNALTTKVPVLQGKIIEFHAGKKYVENGLEAGLCEAGAVTRRLLAKVRGIENQVTWYGNHLAPWSLRGLDNQIAGGELAYKVQQIS